MAYQFKVTYLDGHVDEVLPSPRARIETERHFGGLNESRVQEASFYLAWLSLTKAGTVTDGFDPWLDSIADLEEVKVEGVRPTPPAQSAGTSSV